jgi:hypothetical protein
MSVSLVKSHHSWTLAMAVIVWESNGMNSPNDRYPMIDGMVFLEKAIKPQIADPRTDISQGAE